MTRWTPVAGERVQVEREARDERLALAGLHLGDVALVQDDAAHHLHVEHALLRFAPARLAHGGVGLEQELVERLAVLEPLRNSAVFARSSSSESAWKSGSSVAMYAACCLRRFMRRPSPTRRTFSSLPKSAWASV